MAGNFKAETRQSSADRTAQRTETDFRKNIKLLNTAGDGRSQRSEGRMKKAEVLVF